MKAQTCGGLMLGNRNGHGKTIPRVNL